ncbi:MAG TPA: FtsX-like permease family protein [Pyrinomonadaceae bacterium]|jgi:putative ABC transport system permease protein
MRRALAFVTLRQWRQHGLRLLLTLLGIALGVAVFFAMRLANVTLLSSLRATIEQLGGKATLQVVGGEAGFSPEVLKTVRATPGVQMAEPVTETIARSELPGADNLLVLGLDIGSDLKLYEGLFDENGLVVNNPLAFTTRADSIAVSQSLRSRYGLKDGDTLSLDTARGRLRFTVRGFFSMRGAGSIFGGNVIVMDIYAAQAAFDRGQKFDRIDMVTAPGVAVEAVQQDLRGRLPAGLEVVRPDLRGQNIENAVSSVRLGLAITSLLALTIGVFIIFNSFSISVNQRWKEIGILRSLGVTRREVQQMFLGEAAVMGLIGSAAGVALGYWLANGATRIMSAISVSIYGYVSSAERPAFRWDYAAAAFGVGVFASLLASWLPARAASRLNPVLALHNIETRQRETLVGRPRLALGSACILAGVLLTKFSTPRLGLLVQYTYALLFQLGMILLLPKLIAWGARILRPVMSGAFGAEGVIAVDTMKRAPRRTSATVGALMIGLSFVFSNGAFIQSQKSGLNRSLDKSVSADVLVTTSEQIRSRTYHFTEELARRVTGLPGVKGADTVRVTTLAYNGDEIALLARDMNAWFEISPGLLDEGDAQRAHDLSARGDGFIVSNNFSLRSGVRLGDQLRLETPTGPLVRPVVGLLEYYHSDKGTIFLDRELYKKFWQDDAVDYVMMNLQSGVDSQTFKQEVQRVVAGQQRTFIYTHEEYKQWVTRLIDQFFILTYLQMIVAIFVAGLGLINTLVISVAERQRELGVFRAIGGLRRQVQRMILLEAASISLIGLITGLLAGIFNAYFLTRTAAVMIAGFNLPFRFPVLLALITAPAVLTVGLLAAWWPARRATRLQVAEALACE